MKKQFTLLSILFLGVFVFIGMTIDDSNKAKNFIFTLFSDSPVLPETPFNYADIDFPDHMGSDTIETGYDGNPDTTILDFVTDDKSTLGRVLFYDKKLSAMENISCASCHKQEFSFAEDKDLSEGINTLTGRNSMQLNDIAWSSNDGFFWDMSFSNLEDMIGLPLKDENEVGAVMEDVVVKMYDTDYYADLFEKAFGDDDITEERIVESLAHFISSMVTFESKFDKSAVNNFNDFTTQEMQGLELFQFNCGICHREGSFNEFGFENSNEIIFEFPFFFNNGLETNPEDPGAGSWAPGFEGIYKVPTMRNIEMTGPYMHDGRFETLDDVLDFYSDDVQETEWNFFIPPGGFAFSEDDKSALKAFLETLTDESFLVDEKWSDPFKSPTGFNPTEEVMELSVSPNPMSSFAIIEVENPRNETMTVELYNEIGQLITTDRFDGSQYQLDKNSMTSGIYNIKLSNKSQSKTIKLIVQ